MYDAVALGEVLIDFTCEATDADGYPTMKAHPGGAPANFLAAMTKFGAKTAMIGKVGRDAFGAMLINTLKNIGVDTCGIVSSGDVFTTLAFVTLDSQGEREFSFARKPGADMSLRFDEIDLSLIDKARLLHFGTLSMTDEPARTAARKTVEYAMSRGKLVSFDPNLREMLWKDMNDAKEQMLWGLGRADIVKISREETDFLFKLSPEESAAKIINDFGAKLVFVTCGADGCMYRSRTVSGAASYAGKLRVVDTTGAGDIFGGSAVRQVLKLGKPIENISAEELSAVAKFAVKAASLSVTKPGGISSVPELSEVTG